MDLCSPSTVQAITAARESVEQYLRNGFDEIARLQESENFLDNVEEVQARSDELETWKVQREQLSSVEECAQSCTCDEGANLVLAEYNSLARQEDAAAGLTTVTLSAFNPVWLAVAGIVTVAIFLILRKKKRG